MPFNRLFHHSTHRWHDDKGFSSRDIDNGATAEPMTTQHHRGIRLKGTVVGHIEEGCCMDVRHGSALISLQS